MRTLRNMAPCASIMALVLHVPVAAQFIARTLATMPLGPKRDKSRRYNEFHCCCANVSSFDAADTALPPA